MALKTRKSVIYLLLSLLLDRLVVFGIMLLLVNILYFDGIIVSYSVLQVCAFLKQNFVVLCSTLIQKKHCFKKLKAILTPIYISF